MLDLDLAWARDRNHAVEGHVVPVAAKGLGQDVAHLQAVRRPAQPGVAQKKRREAGAGLGLLQVVWPSRATPALLSLTSVCLAGNAKARWDRRCIAVT